MASGGSRSVKSRIAKQAKTVAAQWSFVVAESLGLRPRTEQTPAPSVGLDGDAWNSAELASCWLGHATTLLKVNGKTLLTDPHFDDRAGLRLGQRKIGRRRAVGVPIGPEGLPPVDVLMLSHAHMDHWDIDSLLRLTRLPWASKASVVIPRGTRDLLPAGFGEVVELDWGKEAKVRGVGMRAVRPKHWGARFVVDRHRGYNAYVLDGHGRRVVFGGDTAMTDAFDHLSSARPVVDLAVMGIGSYEPWEHQHATPEQVAEMSRRMGARLLMPVHHATFHDSNVPLAEPLARLVKAWEPDRLVCPNVGDVWLLPGPNGTDGVRGNPPGTDGVPGPDALRQ